MENAEFSQEELVKITNCLCDMIDGLRAEKETLKARVVYLEMENVAVKTVSDSFGERVEELKATIARTLNRAGYGLQLRNEGKDYDYIQKNNHIPG